MNNELLHGQEYEEITKDPTYTQDIFRRVHQLDPGPKLFLNDYNVVAVGANTDVGKHKFTNRNINQYLPNGLFHPYQLDESILHLRGACLA